MIRREPAGPAPSEVVTIGKGDGSRIVEQRRFVIRDRPAFLAVWTAHAGPDAVAPAVDFDTRMVAAVFAGTRPTPGFDVEIVGTRREDAALTIVVEERVPPRDAVAAQILVAPFHIASLPRDDGEVRFDTPDGPQQTTIVFKPPRAQAGVRQSSRSALPGDWTADGASSTGLTPKIAASIAYLAGPFSGALLLASERTNLFVRFHAWQAVIGLGLLGAAAVTFLVLAFAFLIVSPTGFWAMLWLAAISAVVWLAAWIICVIQAYQGRLWKLPVAGTYAERWAK
jgi:uncharacterized membrane protein